MQRLAPVLFVFLWASGFVGAQAAMPYAEPGTLLTIRFVLAFAILACVTKIMRVPWPSRDVFWLSVLVGMLVHGVYLSGVFWAVRQGMSPAVAAVIVGFQPLISIALARVSLGEKLHPVHILASAIGFIGVVIVVSPGLVLADGAITGATLAATALACVAISIGTVLQRHLSGKSDLRAVTTVQYLGGLVPTYILMLFETREILWTFELAFGLFWLVCILSVGAALLLMWLLNRGTVAEVGTLFFLVPSVAAVMGWLVYEMSLLPVQIAGMGLTAASVWLIQNKAPR